MQSCPAAFGLPVGVSQDAFDAAVADKYIINAIHQLGLHRLVPNPTILFQSKSFTSFARCPDNGHGGHNPFWGALRS
jgi:hypothetical protein